MKFTVAPQVFERLPDVCFGAVAAYGIDNKADYPAIAARLDEAIAATFARFEGKKVREDPAILPYRTAFQSLGVNPNKFMSSIEAMFTRVAKGKGLPHINPIVDLGNALSLKYVLPMGAHDIEQAEGHDIEVRFSTPGDTFIPFGESEAESMPEGELIYTVRANWERSDRTAVTSSSPSTVLRRSIKTRSLLPKRNWPSCAARFSAARPSKRALSALKRPLLSCK